MSWNKGLTKATHPSLRKTSLTMKRKRLDNFKRWRDRMKEEGNIKSNYPPLARTVELAELIGVLLGDGHIEKFPRTERLYLLSNSNNQGFINRYVAILEHVFCKKISIRKMKDKNCTRISFYEKSISKRLGIPCGSRKCYGVKVPSWIRRSKQKRSAFLRGLYEAEGSFCIHKPTSTYKCSKEVIMSHSREIEMSHPW